MKDDEIEIGREQLKEELRIAQAEYEQLAAVEPKLSDPVGVAHPGIRLAFENLKAAETALHDFEVEFPPMP